MSDQRLILTVSQLNSEVNHLLKQGLRPVWVEGEISNLTRASSGHFYFSLKDAGSQLRCALFKGRLLNFKPENGQKVLAFGSAGLYEPRGDYQFVVSQLEMAGAGQLQLQFEALKRRLQAEGLFEPAHKQAIPRFPRSIGVITSPTGAAIRDILNVLQRRCPQIPVVIYPVLVQGNMAAEQIVRAIAQANLNPQCEVLLLARGGGSIEDLWPFNEEKVARAIYASELPIVTGIGHEIDFTIADFVADQRAPTPSAAAELIGPEVELWRHTAQQWELRLERSWTRIWQEKQRLLHQLEHRLQQQSPTAQLQQKVQRLDELEQRLQSSWQRHYLTKTTRLKQVNTRLSAQSPVRLVLLKQQLLERLSNALNQAWQQQLKHSQQRFYLAAKQLHALSPLATLERGYAVVFNEQQHVVSSVLQIKPQTHLSVRFKDGSAECEVKQTRLNDAESTSTHEF